MEEYSNSIIILIDTNNNKNEFIIDHNEIYNLHHTCVSYINDIEEDKDGGNMESDHEIGKLTSESVKRDNNLFITCEYINTGTMLKCTDCVSPRVVIGLPTMLGNNPYELFCGVNAYELLAEGWVDENMTSQDYDDEYGVDEVISTHPPIRRGILSLDEDVDTIMNVGYSAVVTLGKIKVCFDF